MVCEAVGLFCLTDLTEPDPKEERSPADARTHRGTAEQLVCDTLGTHTHNTGKTQHDSPVDKS
jgi:hypothetical protein